MTKLDEIKAYFENYDGHAQNRVQWLIARVRELAAALSFQHGSFICLEGTCSACIALKALEARG